MSTPSALKAVRVSAAASLSGCLEQSHPLGYNGNLRGIFGMPLKESLPILHHFHIVSFSVFTVRSVRGTLEHLQDHEVVHWVHGGVEAGQERKFKDWQADATICWGVMNHYQN